MFYALLYNIVGYCRYYIVLERMKKETG